MIPSSLRSPPAANPARLLRVLLGSAAGVFLIVIGLRWTLAARTIAQSSAAARPEFLELAVRFGGIALLSAGQAVAVFVVLPTLYRRHRGDWLVGAALTTIFVAAALAAAVFALTGA